jgi:hypothetical protein
MVAVTDDFERASVGGNYSNGHGNYGICEITGSSDLRAEGTTLARAIKRDNETFDDDQYAEVTTSAFADNTSTFLQCQVRFQASTAECYVASAQPQGDDTVDIFLEHNDGAGTFTAIGSTVNVSGESGSGDVLRLECEGTTLRVYFRGTLRKTETDSTLTSGHPGCGLLASSNVNDVLIEDAEFGDLVQAPAFVTSPTVTSQDTDTYTLTVQCDEDCTLHGVVVRNDDAAPTIAQVKAGNGTGDVVALQANNTSLTGNGGDTTFDLGGALTRPIHSLYLVATNAGGDSPLISLTDELLDAAAGKQHVVVSVKEITAATKADPGRLTVTGHGFQSNQLTRIWGVNGMTQLNDGGNKVASPNDGLQYIQVSSVDANTLDLVDISTLLYGTYTSGGIITPGFSFLEGSEAADGDVIIAPTTTSPGGYTLTQNVDGTFEYAASGDETRQFVDIDLFDLSDDSFCGVTRFYINNQKPSFIGSGFGSQDWIPDTAITPITLSDFIEDFEGDVLTYVATGLPIGITLSAGVISGTPTTEEAGIAVITATDITGDSTDFSLIFNVQFDPDPPGTGTDPDSMIVSKRRATKRRHRNLSKLF